MLSIQVRAFVFGPLMAGLTIAAAAPATSAQSLDTIVGARVAAGTRQTSQAVRLASRFDLTLEDAVQRALEQNVDIAVQRIHPFVQDMQVAAANAAFLPTASSGFNFNQSTFPNRSVFDGGGLGGRSIVTDEGSYDLGIGQQIRWGGGRYDVTWNSTRSESTNIFSTFNPSFGANMTLEYTQPLLRGFRTDPRRTQLIVSRINRDISDIDLEETIVNTLADVSLAYWDLVHARAAVGVQRQALALAEQFVEDNRFRVEVGTMAPIEVVQAQSEAAARRQLLAQSVETQRTSELALKELLVAGTSDPLWNAEVDPDGPAAHRGDADRPAGGDSRGPRSPHRRLPRATAARYQRSHGRQSPQQHSAGAGPDRQLPTERSGRSPTRARREQFRGHFRRHWRRGPGRLPGRAAQHRRGRLPEWSVRLQMTYPLGRSADRAAYERARWELQQNEAQIRRIELRIASEVTNAALRIESIGERIEAATASRELAEEQLQAEESKYEDGLSTNFFVLQSQRALAPHRMPSCARSSTTSGR